MFSTYYLLSIYVSFHLFLFVYFKFWDGIQNFIPNMWQVVFANVFMQGMFVNSYIYSFFYPSSYIVPLPAYDLEVIHCYYVASTVLVFKYWWMCFQNICISVQRF